MHPLPAVRVRPRVDADLPVLATLLAEQQAGSEYPIRWPLPFPVERFLVRAGEVRAWVAQNDGGAVLGHVSVLGDDDVDGAFRAALPQVDAGALAVVSVLFTSLAARGTGVGGLLLDTAVAWARSQGRVPVLDVVPTHGRAVDLYRRRGWAEIGTMRPAWLAPDRPDLVLMRLPDDVEPHAPGG